ncbi:MAG: 3-methyl-2-oxobutanoate hydroxymethyltransferase [Bacillota bacterium]
MKKITTYDIRKMKKKGQLITMLTAYDYPVLVFHDMTGFNTGHIPKFVRKYGDIGFRINTCVTEYINEVRTGSFPSEDYSFFSEGLAESLKNMNQDRGGEGNEEIK